MKDVILLNNLFNGKYIEDKVGGEIINMYQSDNENYYVYVNPYGNIAKKWDNRIEHILFIRSVGNKVVKIIAKAEIETQINLNALFSKKNNTKRKVSSDQRKYIDANDIKYGGVKLFNLGSWSEYFVTFKAKATYKAKTDIYLTSNEKHLASSGICILKGIKKINNQSQKLYIESINENYSTLKEIIKNNDLWEDKPVKKVSLKAEKENNNSLLSIIKKENDELVISNLLAYFLENDKEFWNNFVRKVLKITDISIVNQTPKITRESNGNIDLYIEVGECVIVIENKIKSSINGLKDDGYSQLEKYVNITDEICKKTNRNSLFYLLRPNYNNEEYLCYNEGKRYQEIKYSEIYEIIKNQNKGFYFDELISIAKKHSSEYDNELFEIMNKRFIEQIIDIRNEESK